MATPRSSRLGCMRPAISGVTRVIGIISASSAAIPSAKAMPMAMVESDFFSKVWSLRNSAIDKDTMGDIKGASTIAPIMTAGLDKNRPRLATKLLSIIKEIKLLWACAFSRNCMNRSLKSSSRAWVNIGKRCWIIFKRCSFNGRFSSLSVSLPPRWPPWVS